jgi:hypothetical protein
VEDLRRYVIGMNSIYLGMLISVPPRKARIFLIPWSFTDYSEKRRTEIHPH